MVIGDQFYLLVMVMNLYINNFSLNFQDKTAQDSENGIVTFAAASSAYLFSRCRPAWKSFANIIRTSLWFYLAFFQIDSHFSNSQRDFMRKSFVEGGKLKSFIYHGESRQLPNLLQMLTEKTTNHRSLKSKMNLKIMIMTRMCYLIHLEC